RRLLKFPTLALALFLSLGVCGAEPASRAVVLKATRNTRDMGGLQVKGGILRPGLLYRSGALCFITPGDVETVNGLHLHTLVELRVAKEIAKDGADRSALSAPKRVLIPMHNSHGLGQEAYHAYIRENSEEIRAFFELLAQESSYPLLFHCSAGKDRTGILAYLLLWSLGAEREVRDDDYLQSQRNAPGLVVKPEWINEVYVYVEECGGIEAYLKKIGVTAETVDAIRAKLVKT
ncbi:unnamed protein product, partial [Phaeothamnion confervicola]